MTNYYLYYRDSTGATWTEETRFTTFRYERLVNRPSTITIIMREEAGDTAGDWSATSIGKHILVTTGTFSGTSGANTLWHGRVRSPHAAGGAGTHQLFCEDWMGQLYDQTDRFTTRRNLKERSVAGYGERTFYDEFRYITAISATTVTDASATEASNDCWNTSCAVVFTEAQDHQRTRRQPAHPITKITYNSWLHHAGSTRHVGVTDNWNDTTDMDTTSMVLKPDSFKGVNFVASFNPIELNNAYYQSTLNVTTIKVQFGVYRAIDTTCTTVIMKIWRTDNSTWEAFSGTTTGGTAFTGEWTDTGYQQVYKTVLGVGGGGEKYVDDGDLVRVKVFQNTYSSSRPILVLNYGYLETTTEADKEARQILTFPITDVRVTGDTAVIASSENFATAGVATNDMYTIAKRSDLFVEEDLVTAYDYEVTLGTANVSSNPVRSVYPNLDWVGVNPITPIKDLAMWDRTDFFVDPATDQFYYNISPSYSGAAAAASLDASSDSVLVVDMRWDFDEFYSRIKIFGHEWGAGETASGEKWQVRYELYSEHAEDTYRMQREKSYVQPALISMAPAMELAQNMLAVHSIPKRRVKLRHAGLYTAAGLGDVIRVTCARHELDELMYLWHWQYDHTGDITEMELLGPVDSWTVSRPDVLTVFIEEVKSTSRELEQRGGTSYSQDGGSPYGKPYGRLPKPY